MTIQKTTSERENVTNKFNLPQNPDDFADKYFLRTRRILQNENINPWVRAQVMIRKGPGQAYGLDEAIAILDKYSDIVKHSGRVYALNEGAEYQPKGTVMLIEAPIQDIVGLETMYLGVIAAETTKANGEPGIDLDLVRKNMAAVVQAAESRDVFYFGARHWRFDEDAAIAKATFEAGAVNASTDIGAAAIGKKGNGTTPHVLENIMAWQYGYANAVPEAMLAFDRAIERAVPRVILCDYRNKEITDTLATARALEGRLDGVRIDTCGENLGEGAYATKEQFQKDFPNIIVPTEDERFWFGNGVTVTGAYAMRNTLDKNGHQNIKITLSSGFANAEKVKAFVRAEKILQTRLFENLGVGQVFKSRASKMDIVAVGETPEQFVPIAKVGRGYNPNPKLELRLGGKR